MTGLFKWVSIAYSSDRQGRTGRPRPTVPVSKNRRTNKPNGSTEGKKRATDYKVIFHSFFLSFFRVKRSLLLTQFDHTTTSFLAAQWWPTKIGSRLEHSRGLQNHQDSCVWGGWGCRHHCAWFTIANIARGLLLQSLCCWFQVPTYERTLA